MSLKVVHLNLGPVDPAFARQILQQIDAEMVVAQCKTEEEVIEVAADADAIIGPGIGRLVTRKGIGGLKRCRLVSIWAGSNDFIDLDAFTDHDICVAYAPDASTEEVANHSMAMMLALNRKLFFYDRFLRDRKGHWAGDEHDEIIDLAKPYPRLSDLTAGCIGFGRAGRALAQRATAFGMRFLAHDPYIAPEAGADLGVDLTSLNRLLSESDFVHIFVPMTDATKQIVGAAELAKMKPTAYLVNSSARSTVIDEPALYAALSSGKLAGAGLDNLEQDPDTENPLLSLPNVIVTPHIAHVSDASYIAMQRRVCEDVVRFFTGEWPVLVANPAIKDKVQPVHA